MNYKNKKKWGIAYVTLICVISLFIASPLFFGLALAPLVLINKEWVISLLLLPSLVGGAINTEDSIIPLGILTVIIISPILILNNLTANKRIPRKWGVYFYLFIIFVILGFLVHVFRFGNDPEILSSTITNLLRIIFSLWLFKFLLNQNYAYLRKSLQNLIVITIPVTICIILYAFTIGKNQIMANGAEIMLFGGAKHGEFTATLTAFSIYIFYWGSSGKKIFFRRILSLVILGGVFYLILHMGSKNGLLSFCVMIFFSLLLFVRAKSKAKRVFLFITGMLVVLSTVLYFSDSIINSPTFERMANQYDKSGTEGVSTNRFEIWRAGVKSMQDATLLGWSGSGKKIAEIISSYGGPNNVMHNTFLQVWVRYGSLALLTFLIFIRRFFFRGKEIFHYCSKNSDYLLFVPVFVFFMLLFSGIGISWFWETQLWYNLVLLLVISLKLENNAAQRTYHRLSKSRDYLPA